jgi:hypothetical protein
LSFVNEAPGPGLEVVYEAFLDGEIQIKTQAGGNSAYLSANLKVKVKRIDHPDI